MKSRLSDKRILVLDESPGVQHLTINGSRLPTYKQVLLCYISNMENFTKKNENKGKKLQRSVAKIVVNVVSPHFRKGKLQ